jgi:hypothetical protein
MAVLPRRQTAVGKLNPLQESNMSQPDIRDELGQQPFEPLLPIEKKLIGWSFGIGVVLLLVLLLINQLFWMTS